MERSDRMRRNRTVYWTGIASKQDVPTVLKEKYFIGPIFAGWHRVLIRQHRVGHHNHTAVPWGKRGHRYSQLKSKMGQRRFLAPQRATTLTQQA